MAKIELDVDKFMELMRGALIASAVPQEQAVKAKPGRKPKVREVVVEPPKERRRRPRKLKGIVEAEQINVFDDEYEDEPYIPPVIPKKSSNGYTVAAKVEHSINAEGKMEASKMEFPKKKPGEVKFIDPGTAKQDNYSVKDPSKRVEYPEHQFDRPPQQKMIFQCQACNQKIEAFPSEYPQSRPIRITGERGREEWTPILKCNDCARVAGNVGYVG